MSNKVSARSNFGLKGWSLTIYAFLVYFFTTATQQLFNAVGPQLEAQYGWTNVQQQSILSISGVIAILAIFVCGRLVMRFSVRKIAIAIALIWAALSVLLGFQVQFTLFAIVLVVVRCFGDALAFSTNGILISHWFPKKSGLVMGWATFGFPLAAGFGTVIMIGGAAKGGVLGAMLPFVGMAVVAVLILLFIVRADYPEQCGAYPDNDKNAIREENADMPQSEWTTKKIMSNKEFWLITLAMGLMLFSAGFMTQVANALMSIGFNMELMVPVMLGISIAACIGSYICGVLDVKFGTRKAVMITDGALLLMAILVQFDSVVTTFIAFGCLGVVMGGGSNYLVSWMTSKWGRHNFKNIFGLSMPICNIFSAVAPVIIAAVAAAFGGFKASFVMAGILALISFALALAVKDTTYFTAPSTEEK